MKQGWLHVGPGHDYDYEHTQKGMTPYTSDFDLFRLLNHHIGAGALSFTFRRHVKSVVDEELQFTERQQFGDLVGFRFPAATSETLKDFYQAPRTPRQTN